MLDKETIEIFKKSLKNKESELEALVKEMKNPPDFGDDVDSYEEEAEEAEAFSANLGKEKLFHERLHQIKSALKKIKEGAYGKCEKCGKEISVELLKVNPESQLCRKCKTN